MNDNKLIQASDQIVATLELKGRVLASVCSGDFRSIADIANCIFSQVGDFSGLAKLTVRNRTQGWRVERPMARRVRIAS